MIITHPTQIENARIEFSDTCFKIATGTLYLGSYIGSEDEKVEIPDWGLQEEAVESEEVTIPDITEPSESEATKADQIGPTDSAVADTDLIDEALGEAAPVSEAPAEEPPGRCPPSGRKSGAPQQGGNP